MATQDSSPSSIAVLKSLLALSSLDRYGVQAQALEMKLSAIQALAVSAQSLDGEKEIMQHVAAGMLLCCCEVSGENQSQLPPDLLIISIDSGNYQNYKLLDMVYWWD